MLSKQVKDVARKIGEFYLEKNHRYFAAARQEIESIGITRIDVLGDGKGGIDSIAITAKRVGVLIGRRGENIEKLTSHLKVHVKLVEEEDNLDDYLLPSDEEAEWLS